MSNKQQFQPLPKLSPWERKLHTVSTKRNTSIEAWLEEYIYKDKGTKGAYGWDVTTQSGPENKGRTGTETMEQWVDATMQQWHVPARRSPHHGSPLCHTPRHASSPCWGAMLAIFFRHDFFSFFTGVNSATTLKSQICGFVIKFSPVRGRPPHPSRFWWLVRYVSTRIVKISAALSFTWDLIF